MADGSRVTSKTFTFLHVGRFDAVKDHETLLAAWAIVQANHPSVELICVGRGTASFEFGQLLIKHGVHNTVRGIGQSHSMPTLYAKADAFVLSSVAENSPLVIAEALACGLPVVSTDVGDAKEVIGYKGVVAPAKSPERLAQSMLYLVNDTCCAEVAREFGPSAMRERFDPLRFATAWNDILATPADAPTVSLSGFAKRALQSLRALLWEAVPPVRAWLMALCAFGLSAVTTHIIAPAIPAYGYLAWVKTQIEWSGMILWAFGMWPILGHVYNTIIGGVVDKTINTLKATSK